MEIKTQFFYSSYRRKLKNAFAPMYPRTDKVSGDIAYVEKLLGSGDPLKIKQAVILVDDVTASVFNILGYPDDFKGAVGYFKTYLHNAEEFLTDHDVIIALKNDKDKNKSLTKWEAEKIIKNYKQALQDLQAL